VQYASALAEWAVALKSMDPGMQIGANGPSSAQAMGDMDKEAGNYVSWWETVLRASSSSIDFLVIHSYPIWGWNYDDYVSQSYNLAVSSLDR
jgi:alpha-L-arabinofuranosidase